MSEQAGGARCQWSGCAESATERAARMTYPEARVTIRHLCGRHYEELETAGGAIAAPPDAGRWEKFAEGEDGEAGPA